MARHLWITTEHSLLVMTRGEKHIIPPLTIPHCLLSARKTHPRPSLRAEGVAIQYPPPVIASRRRGNPLYPARHCEPKAWQSSLKNNKPILQGYPLMVHHVAFAPRDDEFHVIASRRHGNPVKNNQAYSMWHATHGSPRRIRSS